MAIYEKPSILSLQGEDLLELHGPAETQYCMVVSSTPAVGANINPGDQVVFTTNCTIDPATVSDDDVSLKAELPPSITKKGPSWDVTASGNTITVDFDNLPFGWGTITIPADGQEILGTNGEPLAQYVLRIFNLPPTDSVFLLNNAGECVAPDPADDEVLKIPLIVHLENPSICPNEVRMCIQYDPSVLNCFNKKIKGYSAGDPPFDNPTVTEYYCDANYVHIGVTQETTFTPDCAIGHENGNYLVGYAYLHINKETGSTNICLGSDSWWDTLVGDDDWVGNMNPDETVGTCYNKDSNLANCEIADTVAH